MSFLNILTKLKTKQLISFLVLASIVFLSAAQSVSSPDIDRHDFADAYGIPIPVILTLPESGDVVDIHFDITLPQGLTPSYWYSENGFGWAGKDVPIVDGNPVIEFSDNLDTDGHTLHIDGMNDTRTPTTANPCEIYVFKVFYTTSSEKDVTRPIMIHVKYTDSAGMEHEIGSADAPVVLNQVGFDCSVPAERIYIQESVILALNESLELRRVIEPWNAYQPLSWRSTDTTTVLVDSLGVVTGRHAGEALVIATTTDGTNLSDTCFVSVLAVRRGVSAPSLNLYSSDLGQPFALPLTLFRSRSPYNSSNDFLNIVVNMQFPDGIRPMDVDEFFDNYETDLPVLDIFADGNHPLMFTDNFHDYSESGQYYIVGANMKREPIYKNPCSFYYLPVVCTDQEFTPGERVVTYYCKYSDSSDYTIQFGSETNLLKMFTVRCIDGVRGDVNGDGIVDIDDVNELINVILKYHDPSLRCHLTPDDLIDIDDLNALIDMMVHPIRE